MAFVCPDCDAAALTVRQSIELPADSRSDEITLQLVRCTACGFRGAAVYEESRRGALDDECWDHTGYRLSDDHRRALAEAILACPDPSDAHCDCDSHQRLGQRDETGRWVGLGETTGVFAMRRSG